jgi:hypothetical protein
MSLWINASASRGLQFTVSVQTITGQLLEDVPLATRQSVGTAWQGSCPNSSHDIMRYSDSHYPGPWIGRNGPVVWPPWSPDLTPFFYCEKKYFKYKKGLGNAHPACRLLQTCTCGAICRASFKINDVTLGASCGMPRKRLERSMRQHDWRLSVHQELLAQKGSVMHWL